VDRLTRKELKSDHFALEVQHGVQYVSGHRQQLIRWGGVAAAVIVLIAAFLIYRNYQHAARQNALREAIRISNANVGQASGNDMILVYPTAEDRTKALVKSLTNLHAKYPSSDEGILAQFQLAVNSSDEGNTADSERRFREVVDSGNAQYSSMAKLSLAQLYGSQGKMAEGEKLIQSLIDHPTILISKEEAIIALAELLAPTDPQRARKLVEPLRSSPRPNISGKAISFLSDLQKPK
jgi:predicted negative regulator of RcsB-dependent stress response